MDGECGETPPSFGQKICLSLKAKLESSPTSCWAQDALLYGGADPPNSAGRMSLREKKNGGIDHKNAVWNDSHFFLLTYSTY